MADHILTQDPTKPGVVKGNGPILAPGNTVPLTGLDVTGANNGDVIALVGGVWTPGTGGASSDTASNLGSGTGVFASKVGADFQFKSLVSGAGIGISSTATEITIANTASSGVFTNSFISSAQVITPGGALTIAHLLGAMPTLVQHRIRCTTAEAGYSINDELIIPVQMGDTASYGTSTVVDATNVYIRYGASGGGIYILNKGTGAGASITAANWVLIIRAWR